MTWLEATRQKMQSLIEYCDRLFVYYFLMQYCLAWSTRHGSQHLIVRESNLVHRNYTASTLCCWKGNCK